MYEARKLGPGDTCKNQNNIYRESRSRWHVDHRNSQNNSLITTNIPLETHEKQTKQIINLVYKPPLHSRCYGNENRWQHFAKVGQSVTGADKPGTCHTLHWMRLFTVRTSCLVCVWYIMFLASNICCVNSGARYCWQPREVCGAKQATRSTCNAKPINWYRWMHRN